jgi:hypothetical protein
MGDLIKRWTTISMLNVDLVSATERCAMTIFGITISVWDLISLQRVVSSSLTMTTPPTPCCLCCGPRLVVNCCDICHPMYFQFAVAELSDKALKPSRKLMPKAYERGPAEESLWKDLVSLRRDLAKDEALMLTAKALMPDSLLDRIIDLVHHRLIKTVKILHEQIIWGYLDKCDDTVFDLIDKHCPIPKTPSLFTTTPLQCASTSKASNGPLAAVSTHSGKCRACQICGMLGHYSTWFLAPYAFANSLIDTQKTCPQRVIAVTGDKENIDNLYTTQTPEFSKGKYNTKIRKQKSLLRSHQQPT